MVKITIIIAPIAVAITSEAVQEENRGKRAGDVVIAKNFWGIRR